MLRIHRTIYALIPLLTAGILSLTVIQPVSAKVTPKPASVKVIVVKNDITMSGLDLHDGTINYVNGMFYMYGTMYACGFTWGTHNTPFCGFGVSTAPSITGPWTTPTLLFSPTATVDTTGGNWAVDNGQTWNWVCGSDGAGCLTLAWCNGHPMVCGYSGLTLLVITSGHELTRTGLWDATDLPGHAELAPGHPTEPTTNQASRRAGLTVTFRLSLVARRLASCVPREI